MDMTVSTGVKKSGMIDVKKNTVVTVIEKNGLQEAGGARRLSFSRGSTDLRLSSSREALLCTSLEVTMPTDGSYLAFFTFGDFCYPFMHTLTLNRHSPVTYSRIVNGPLFARSLERLLRFNNFPSLRRIVVKSVCCVLFE